MNIQEAKVVLSIIATNYPAGLRPDVTKITVQTWADLLEDVPLEIVQVAVKAWIANNKYPPTIADIREYIFREQETDLLPEEAWSKLHKAIRKYGHTQKDRAENFLGERLWAEVGMDWAYYCGLLEKELPNEKARFMRMYKERIQREKETKRLPANLQKALKGIGGMERLGSGDGEG